MHGCSVEDGAVAEVGAIAVAVAVAVPVTICGGNVVVVFVVVEACELTQRANAEYSRRYSE